MVDVAAGASLTSYPVRVPCHRSHWPWWHSRAVRFPSFWSAADSGRVGAAAWRSDLSSHVLPRWLAHTQCQLAPVSTRRAFICLATSPLARLSLSRAAVTGQDSQRRGTFAHSVPLRHWPMWRPAPHTHLSSRRRCPGWRSAAAFLLSCVAVAQRSGSALSPIPRRCICL